MSGSPMDGGAVTGFNHTSFTVEKLDDAIAFFSDCLGFEVMSRAGRDPAVIERIVGVPGAEVEIAYLRNGPCVLELIEYGAPVDRAHLLPRPCDVGFAHVAFDVRGTEAMIARAARYGVMPIGPTVTLNQGGPNEGSKITYLRMRDGTTIEFIERP